MLPYRDSRFVRMILGLFFVLLVAYALFEARGIFFGPEIHVPNTSISTDEELTLIKGRAERIVELRLNGKTISVTESGEFEETYLLAEGSNRLILEASDARGRTTQEFVDIVYAPKKAASPVAPSKTSKPPTP